MSLYRQVPEGWKPGATYQDFLSKRAPTSEPEDAQQSNSQDALTPGRQRALEVAERLRAAHPAVGELAIQATLEFPAPPILTDEERNIIKNNPGHIPHVDN